MKKRVRLRKESSLFSLLVQADYYSERENNQSDKASSEPALLPSDKVFGHLASNIIGKLLWG